MANICKDLRRRCMSIDDWPQSDRAAWRAAIAEGSLLSDAGLAARWRDGTRRRVMQSYGRFLTFFSNERDFGDEEARA